MEILDIYDINRFKTGKTIVRGSDFGQGEYRVIINICIINSSNQMLIQKRHKNKKFWGGFWGFTTSGSVSSGETSKETAQRELLEEIGLKKDFSDIRPKLTIPYEDIFADYYIFCEDIKIEDLKIQKEEVEEVQWASKDMIYKLMDEEKFIPYYKELIDLIFVMKDNAGPRLLKDSL